MRSFLALGITEVESHVITLITWSKPQKTDRWWSFIINLYISKIGSHNLGGSGDYIVFYLSRDSMSPCNFRVKGIGWVWSLSFTHQSAKCGGHKSCGSGDMIYFNLWRKKKDTHDYLITKSGNAVLQAFLAYFVSQSAAN